MLARKVLEGIADDRLLGDRRIGNSPYGDLIDGYAQLASTNDNLPSVQEDWTAGDLKEAIAQVPAEQQVVLLYKYVHATKSLSDPWTYAETPAARDERRHKHWMAKMLLTCAILVIFMILGAMIVLGVKSGDVESGPMVDTFLNTVLEIMKLIFSSSAT